MDITKKLQVRFCIFLAVLAALAAVLEMGWYVLDAIEQAYFVQMAVIASTLVCVPLGLKWMFRKGVRQGIKAHGEGEYFRNAMIAFKLEFIPLLLGVLSYYTILDMSMFFCALIALVGIVMMWPTRARLEGYMSQLADEEKEGAA